MVIIFIGCKMTITTYIAESVVCPMKMSCWLFEIVFMAIGSICCVCLCLIYLIPK